MANTASSDPAGRSGELNLQRGDGLDQDILLGGRYALGRLLGSGGLGAVFAARDRELDRSVAVKLLRRSQHNAPDALPRLIREANAMARVNHDNVVKVFDVGRYQHLDVDALPVPGVSSHGAFVVMELVRGRDLHQWLDVERPNAMVLEVFRQAGRGLAAAHAQGVVHRDFKPANVLLSDDGVAKVTDFGLAAAYAPTGSERADDASPGELTPASSSAADAAWQVTSLTRTGFTMGTPAYMSPEQHRGQPVDARADQYAYCVAMAEALYGERPARGNTLDELLHAKLHVRLPPRRGVSAGLRRALSRGMSPEAADRFDTMDALLTRMRPGPLQRRWPHMLVGAGLVIVGALSWPSPPRAPRSADPTAASGPHVEAQTPRAVRRPNRVAFVDRPQKSGDGPEQRRSIRASMDELAGGGMMDRPAERTRTILRIVAQAEALGDPALAAEAQLFYALDLHNAGDNVAARVAGESAYRLAEAAEEHGVAARAATVLMGLENGATDAWRRWVGLTEVHASLSFGDPYSELALSRELGSALQQQDEFEGALSHWQQAAALSEELLGPDHIGTASALSMLGAVYIEVGNAAEAQRLLRRSLDIAQNFEPINEDFVAQVRVDLAMALLRGDNWLGAMNQLDKVLQPLAEVGDSVYLRNRQATARWYLGRGAARQGRHEEAVAYYRDAAPMVSPDFPHNGLAIHHDMAESLLAMGRRDEAVASLRAGLRYTDPDAPEWEERVVVRSLLEELARSPATDE